MSHSLGDLQLVIEMARLVDVGLESKDISFAHRLPVRNGRSDYC